MSSPPPSESQHSLGIDIPNDLVTAKAKLVYVHLTMVARATVQELKDHLGIPQLSLYGILKTLAEKGYVEREGDYYALVA